MSAPCSIGWIRYGVAMVLSTISGHPLLVRDRGDAGDVEDVDLRVGDRLAEERLGVRPHGRPPRLEVVGILDEADLDAELGQRVVEEVVGAAVQARAGDDVVAGGGEVEDRERLGGLTGGQEQRRHAALERGDALLDHVLGRVHDAGVDVARLGEAEQRGGVVGAVERVRGGLVDRQRPRVGGASGVWPAWICLVSNAQSAVGSDSGLVMDGFSWDGMGLAESRPARRHVDKRRQQRSSATTHGGPPRQVSLSLGGPVLRTRACRAAAADYSTWSSPGAPHRGWRVAGQQAGA